MLLIAAESMPSILTSLLPIATIAFGLYLFRLFRPGSGAPAVRPHRGHDRPIETARNAAPTPARLSPEAQWQRLTDIVTAGFERSQRIRDLHAAAMVQVDAAEHAFERLLDEISGLVTLPDAAPQPVLVVATAQPRAGRRLAA